MMAKPDLRLVDPLALAPKGAKAAKSQLPDALARKLLLKRRSLAAQIRAIEGELFGHRRRKADDRGQLPPLTLEQLEAELLR